MSEYKKIQSGFASNLKPITPTSIVLVNFKFKIQNRKNPSLQPHVRFADMRVFQQFLSGSAQRDFSVFQHITPVGDFK